VLTSQHVVQQIDASGGIEEAIKIEVEIDVDGTGIEKKPATLLWTGEQKLDPKSATGLDVALLQDQLPAQDLKPFLDLIWQPLASCEWDSAGYVLASPNYKLLRPDELKGEVGAVKPGETFLELIVRRDRPNAEEGWAGISGAPVFVSSGPYQGFLYGVIRRCVVPMEDTLYAVALPALLRNQGLCSNLGIASVEDERKRLAEDLDRLLRANQKVADCIACAHEAWSEGQNQRGVEGLVEAIMQQGELPEILEELQALRERWAERDDQWSRAFQRAAMLLASLVGGRSLLCYSDQRAANRLVFGVASPNLALAERIVVRNGDANEILVEWATTSNWRSQRAVVFLDPYGMQVEWSTLEAIAGTMAIDLWLLFPLGQGVNRLLMHDSPPTGAWADRLTAIFGTDEWRSAFYQPTKQLRLFDDEPRYEKSASFDSIAQFFLQRLDSIFERVAPNPLVLMNSRNNPIFLLCFAAANKKGATTAVKIARDLLGG
jgi:three-Cys-motif partner protein